MEKYTIEFLCSSNYYSSEYVVENSWRKDDYMNISVILQQVQSYFCYVIMYMSEGLVQMHD